MATYCPINNHAKECMRSSDRARWDDTAKKCSHVSTADLLRSLIIIEEKIEANIKAV